MLATWISLHYNNVNLVKLATFKIGLSCLK